MNKVLFTLAAVGAFAVAAPFAARAQSPVFPMTTRAGKLDGAAPGSVQVSIGVTLFSGIQFTSGSGDHDANHVSNPNLLNYVRLYPNFDYTSPAGVHFGVSAEVRSQGAREGENRNTNTLYWHSGSGYVSSPRFGKFAFGTPNDVIDQLGVGSGDDYGTGGFYGEYGFPNGPLWLASDAYDGQSPKQKLVYFSPVIAGFTIGVSYQPTSVGLNNSSGLLDVNSTPGAPQSKDRVEAGIQFSHAFGPIALKADAAYAHADAAPYATDTGVSSVGFQKVNFANAGASVTFAGLQVEGQVNTGRFAANSNDSGSPFGPLLSGQKPTTSYIIGVGYTFGPFTVGAQYYGADFDAADASNMVGARLPAGPIGKAARMGGEAVEAGYQVGPGVGVYLDALTDTARANGAKVHGNSVGLGTYFSW